MDEHVVWLLTDVECAGCRHWWRAVHEHVVGTPQQCFGMECPACGEMRGRDIKRAEAFRTAAEAIVYCREVLGADEVKLAQVYQLASARSPTGSER